MRTPSIDPRTRIGHVHLKVADLERALAFYVGVLGFAVLFDRAEENFACVGFDGAEVMLEEPVGRTWLAAALERPFGRGLNLQIETRDATALHDRCRAAGAPIFLPLEDKAYRQGAKDVFVRQFIVQDPDGYLLRFSQRIPDRAGDNQ